MKIVRGKPSTKTSPQSCSVKHKESQKVTGSVSLEYLNRSLKFEIFGAANLYGKIKETNFCLSKGKGVEKNSGVKRKAFIKGRQRCPYQGSSTSYPDLCNAML